MGIMDTKEELQMRKFHTLMAVRNTGRHMAVKVQKTAVFNIQRNRRTQPLNSAFRRVFGSALKKKGFVAVQEEYPYLARMAGDEVFHVVACMDEECTRKGYREFSVLGAAATVYRGTVSLDESPRSNDFWLRDLGAFYEKTHPSYDRGYHARLVSFAYRENDAGDLDKKLEQALGETEKIMLPVLDAAANPRTCVEYLWSLDSIEPLAPGYENARVPFGKTPYEDGLLLVQTKSRDDYRRLALKLAERDMERGGRERSRNSCMELLHEHENRRLDIVAQRDEIYAEPEIYKKAVAELGRRRRANQETLRSYGLKF